MEDQNLAKECGLRCRRIRMARGISQADLAEKLHTTPQNISKLEKNGIADIDWIKRISDALGADLLSDETDIEGTVGEVGKEILYQLIKNEGEIEFYDLLGESMYGMEESRLNEEIFKLERIGMAVREIYRDFLDDEYDCVFITAKGLITYKNQIGNSYLEEKFNELLPNVITFEKRLAPSLKESNPITVRSYQEYFDKRPLEKKIINLKPVGLYQIGFIQYLKKTYETGKIIPYSIGLLPVEYFPGESFYYDLMYRMTFDLTNEVLYNKSARLEQKTEIETDVHKSNNNIPKLDPVINKANFTFWLEFDKDMEYISASHLNLDDEDEYEEDDEDEYETDLFSPQSVSYLLKKYEDPTYGLDKDTISADDFEVLLSYKNEKELERFKKLASLMIQKKSEEREHGDWPEGWFTVKEIKAFIKENYFPAKSDEEKTLDSELKSILNETPKAKEYFMMPKEWEENGLAQMIRDIYGMKM